MDDLRALAEAATPGPWEWYGDTRNKSVYLSTKDRGRMFVMRFVRWGMRDAQPMFTGPDGMVPASDRAIYEVAPDATDPNDPRLYRHDFAGLRHPDARYIAAIDPTTLLALLDERDALLAIKAAAVALVAHDSVDNFNALCDAVGVGDEPAEPGQ